MRKKTAFSICTAARSVLPMLCSVALAAVSQLALAQVVSIGTSNGISVQQITYPDTTPQVSATGILNVDLVQLRQTTGLQSGFINMTLEGDWVVKNLVVQEGSDYPYSRISTNFDLKVSGGMAVDSLATVSLMYSDAAVTDEAEISAASQTLQVSPVTFSVGGVPSSPVTAPPSPPNLTDILFGDPTNTDAITQFDHPNIEAAVNQCMPASIANSLQFLEDTTDLEIPHDNVAGLKGDDSLVGQLDTFTDRTVVGRRSDQNSGTWGIEGKMKYLATNGLQDRVQTTHMGSGGVNGADDFSATIDGKTASATGLGENIAFDTLLDAMKEGQDCELVYAWEGGSHAVDAVAAGKTRGEPWIVHGSDLNQDDDSLGAGPEGFQFEYLKDTDEDGRLNLSGTDTELVQVICEKFIPPPSETTVTDVEDPSGHSCCVEPPPAEMRFLLDGFILTVDGEAPWLPMIGTVDANGDVSLSSNGTVAGFPNVASTLTGKYDPQTNTVLDATISLGTNGALPGGNPITYSAEFTSGGPAAEMELIIRANGFRDAVTIGPGDGISLALEFHAADQQGIDADWWAVGQTGGATFSYDLASGQFIPGLAVTYQGPLADLPFTDLVIVPDGLPSGDYIFYFGVETNQDGLLDLEQVVLDSVELNVR